MPPLIQDDEIVVIFLSDGILPFDDLKTARELNEVYGLVLPFEMGVNSGYSNPSFGTSELSGVRIRKYRSYSSPCPMSGNWFAGAIKRQRMSEIKASRTDVSLDISRALDLPVELLLEVCPELRILLIKRLSHVPIRSSNSSTLLTFILLCAHRRN